MKHYKDENGQVYAFESDGSQDDFIPPSLTRITEAEADLIRNPPPTQAELDALAAIEEKAQKVKALNSITVKTSTGKVFDGNESARNNMLSALQAAEFLNQTEAGWKLADNSVEMVAVDELKEALALSIQRVGEIITN